MLIGAFATISLLLGLPFARAAPNPTASSSLVVKLTAGSFQGVRASNGTERWLGVPFAQPPLGNLRFKPPVAITNPKPGIQDASEFGNACPQMAGTSRDPGTGAPREEDCLFINIWRPTGTQSNAKLPILVWFYGGGYNSGASSDPTFEPTRIVQRSVAIGKPIIFVSLNYRVNTFGFIASSFIDPEDLNVGFQDQRLALLFLQQNVAKFGGDPAKVTIWGQSAGAGSVETHILFPPPQTLFRAGILDSSTGPFKGAPFAAQYDAPGKPFFRLNQLAGCPVGPTSIACLQRVPSDTLMGISNLLLNETLNNQLWEPAVAAGSLIPERPSDRIASGNFLRVPLLWGTNNNEGTKFSMSVRSLGLSGAAETAAFDNFTRNLILDGNTLTSDVLSTFHQQYPANDPANGAPFNTGDSLFDRAEAWYTDNMYLAPRRLFFNKAAAQQPLFGYFFDEFIPGNDPTLGVFHGSELSLIFGPVPNSVENQFANFVADAWITFVNDLNPGPSFPRYNLANKTVLQLKRGNTTVIPDNFKLSNTNFMNSAKVLNEFEK